MFFFFILSGLEERKEKLLRQGRKEKNMENHAKIFMIRDIKFSFFKSCRKVFGTKKNSCTALMKKIIKPQFFMCENSRRDEKSLNDDWRKLQKTLRGEKEREDLVFGCVVQEGRGRGALGKRG